MNAESKIQIILADDQTMVRIGFVAYINTFSNDMVVCGQSSNGAELLDLLKTVTPDIVLLDLDMPVKNGFETLKEMNVQFPTTKTIILSSHYSETIGAELIALGARAFLRKNCEPEELLSAIRKVHGEGFSFNKDISLRLVKRFMKQKKVDELIRNNLLTEREVEVLQFISEGKTYKEIAEALYISTDTVKFHLGRIYKKIKVDTQAALIKYAIRIGLTSAY